MMLCTHCDEVVLVGHFNRDDETKMRPFCCFGCQTVYNTLHDIGLETYYEIKKNSEIYKRRSPVDTQSSEFKYIDDPEFLSEFSYSTDNYLTMEFYLEGIHCLACLWLVEKLPVIIKGVVSSKLDIERSVATVVIDGTGQFSQVAKEFSKLGYRPHPLKNSQDSQNLKAREERSSLIRIGVAGASAGNIMIYAVSIYAGAVDRYAEIFNGLTILFALPVLTYSAYPFYKNAWSAIRNRSISIDIPISFALVVGAIMGFYNVLVGIQENYFDSLCTLVFLLLLSRYFLQKIQEKGLSAKDLHFFYLNDSVLKANNLEQDDFIEIHPKFIKAGDIIKVMPNDFLAADGRVIKGNSKMNRAFLTGESTPVSVEEGDEVFSGTQNLSRELVIEVSKTGKETRLGHILKNVENGWSHRSDMIDLTSKISKYFTLVICLLAIGLFLFRFFQGDVKIAIEQALTLLIVTCPCALALSIPLTFTRSLSKASKLGIIIKNDRVLEKTSKLKNVFIDKTGTLTHGKLQIVDFLILISPSNNVFDIVYALESRSSHPVARALADFSKVRCQSHPDVVNFEETLGRGVKGEINGVEYSIREGSVFERSCKIASFKVEDSIREDSKGAVSKLTKEGLSVHILSGDNANVVTSTASQVGIPPENSHFALSPEMKSLEVAKHTNTLMIGDGANDAIVLSEADVGVAVLGAMDISLRAAEVYLTTPGLNPVVTLLTLSKETMKVIRRNLILSLGYNFLSVIAAFMGLISPLVAAIVMPLSSLTVLLSTLAGTKKMRALWK